MAKITEELIAEMQTLRDQGLTATTRFTLAVDRALSKDKKQEAEGKGQPTADFVPVTVWGKQAEIEIKDEALAKLRAENAELYAHICESGDMARERSRRK